MLAALLLILGLQVGLIAALVFFLLRASKLAASAPDTPFIPTPAALAPAVLAALDVRENDIVYDLGSGDGRLLIRCALIEPRARFVGVERGRILYLVAHFRKFLAGNPPNVKFRREDFHATSIVDATKIYVYLLGSVLETLSPILERDFRGRLASRAFRFARKMPSTAYRLDRRDGFHNQHMLYVYDFL